MCTLQIYAWWGGCSWCMIVWICLYVGVQLSNPIVWIVRLTKEHKSTKEGLTADVQFEGWKLIPIGRTEVVHSCRDRFLDWSLIRKKCIKNEYSRALWTVCKLEHRQFFEEGNSWRLSIGSIFPTWNHHQGRGWMAGGRKTTWASRPRSRPTTRLPGWYPKMGRIYGCEFPMEKRYLTIISGPFD